MNEVNVLIFNEYGPSYCVNGFNANYARTIVLAYRLGVNSVRNHYDSIVKIEQNDIFECSKIIAENIANQQIRHMETDIVLEDSAFI